MDLERLIRDVTLRKLCSEEYWKKHGIPMPARYLTEQIEIPASIRRHGDTVEGGNV